MDNLTAVKELSSRIYGKKQLEALASYAKLFHVDDFRQLSEAQLLDVRQRLESVESRVTRYNRGRNY